MTPGYRTEMVMFVFCATRRVTKAKALYLFVDDIQIIIVTQALEVLHGLLVQVQTSYRSPVKEASSISVIHPISGSSLIDTRSSK